MKAFRLNDKCAAGTGAFLEKTARYMGYATEEIGPLVATSKEPVPISGVCAVFAESEVINHALRRARRRRDIMHGAIVSLVGPLGPADEARAAWSPSSRWSAASCASRRMVAVVRAS